MRWYDIVVCSFCAVYITLGILIGQVPLILFGLIQYSGYELWRVAWI